MDLRTELEQKVINKSNSRVLHESKIPAVGNGRGINEFYRELFIQFFRNVWSVRFQIIYSVDARPCSENLESLAIRILVW